MNNTKKEEYKRKYAMAKHHAWAGSVLLAILGALRWFVDDTKWYQKDIVFIIIGMIIILYILIALFLTYRFRSGLSMKQNVPDQNTNNQQSSISSYKPTLSSKDQEKLGKKQAKNDFKKQKKSLKAKEKQDKKTSQ